MIQRENHQAAFLSTMLAFSLPSRNIIILHPRHPTNKPAEFPLSSKTEKVKGKNNQCANYTPGPTP